MSSGDGVWGTSDASKTHKNTFFDGQNGHTGGGDGRSDGENDQNRGVKHACVYKIQGEMDQF